MDTLTINVTLIPFGRRSPERAMKSHHFLATLCIEANTFCSWIIDDIEIIFVLQIWDGADIENFDQPGWTIIHLPRSSFIQVSNQIVLT
jgi:hypothetical protein